MRSLVSRQTGHGRTPSRLSGGPCIVATFGLATIFLATFLYVDPFYTGYDQFRVTRDLGPAKYTVVIAALFSILAGFLAVQLKQSEVARGLWPALLRAWPLMALVLMISAGSIYARIFDDQKETFLPFASAAIGYVLGLTLIKASNQPHKVFRGYLILLTAALFYVVPAVVLKRLDGGQAFHTEIFLAVPILMYFLIGAFHWIVRLTAASAMVVLVFFLHKNLGYISFLISIALMVYLKYRPAPIQERFRRTVLVLIAAIVALPLVAGGAFYMYQDGARHLPSGNIEIRSEVYRKALNDFVQSPVYGDMFSSSSLVDLQQARVLGRRHVTTHSDWLDILAHGGLIATMLFVAATVVPLVRSAGVLRVARETQADHHMLLAAMWAICATGLVVSMFVSMFLSLPVAFMFWLTLGFVDGSATNN